MEWFRSYNDFQKRMLNLHPDSQQFARITPSALNREIIQSLKDKTILRIVDILGSVCLNTFDNDYLLSALYSSLKRKSWYYIYVGSNNKMTAFSIVTRENRTEFRQNLNQLKQYLIQQGSPFPKLIHMIQEHRTNDYNVFSVDLICSCKKGGAQRLFQEIPLSISNQSFILTVDNPPKHHKKYYQSLGFVYEKDLFEWSGMIYKLFEL